MYFGYNTNGFAHHRLDDTLAILAELGYDGVGLTVDHNVLNPFEPNWRDEAERVRRLLEKYMLTPVIETGARFLLDPRRKHQPTLLSPTPEERRRRFDFLSHCIELASLLGSKVVSFWSGTAVDDASDDVLWERLVEGCRELLRLATEKNVSLAFEPEPGMFVDNMRRLNELFFRLDQVACPMGLTLDIGHLQCQGETPIADHIQNWRGLLWNVHIEDMFHGVHDHRMFGEGEIDFPPVLAALREIKYAGGLFVELSRHSHDAVRVARESIAFLRKL